MSALEEFMTESARPEGVERPGFKITDEGGANWALRKLAAIRRRQRISQQVADKEIERVNEWLRIETEREQNDADFFEGLLREYQEKRLAEDPHAKTLRFPAGTLKARKSPDRVETLDGFISWAAINNRDLLRTKVEPNLSVIKDAVLSDGEVIPHTQVIEGTTKFSVEVSDGRDTE